MNVVVAIIIGIVVLAAVVLFAIWETRRRRRAKLQQRFGPEYEREVRARGSERDADQYLSEVGAGTRTDHQGDPDPADRGGAVD